MPKREYESEADWHARAEIENVIANADYRAQWYRLGLDRAVPPGRLRPELDAAYLASMHRADAAQAELSEAINARAKGKGRKH